jgi:hypothetical protein
MIIIDNIEDMPDYIFVSNPFDGKPEDTLWSMSIFDAKNNIVKSFLFNDSNPNREYISFESTSIEDIKDGEYVVRLTAKGYDIATRMRIGDISHSNVMNETNTYYTTIKEDVFYEG